MKKVLIISYFYPPSNFVGGERTEAWFRYLQEEGFYPIVVTRCWNEGQSDIIGELKQNEYSIERSGNGEVHRVPVPGDLRNKIGGPIRKLLTLRRLLQRNTDVPVNEFKTLYAKCVEILREDPAIKTVIASGRPFESFQIGYLLKKEFEITWIPDYRDEWNSHQDPTDQSWIWNKIKKQELEFERIWTSNADSFISVTQPWTERIADYIEKPGTTIMNGFETENELLEKTVVGTDKVKLILTYAGTLYPMQELNTFLNALKKVANQYPDKLELNFVGTETVPEVNKTIEDKLKQQRNILNFHARMSRPELEKFIQKTDILIVTSFPNVKGWLPVKLFDYFRYNKPILLCPGDSGEMESFMKDTNAGFVINDVKEGANKLAELLQQKIKDQPVSVIRNLENALFYTRKEQTKKLAALLNTISE